MKTHVTICDCRFPEHNYVWKYDEEDEGHWELVCHTYLSAQYKGWFGRLKVALNYLFGRHGRHGDFDCILVSREQAVQLRDFLNNYLELNKHENS
jgi:hypothetical protein